MDEHIFLPEDTVLSLASSPTLPKLGFHFWQSLRMGEHQERRGRCREDWGLSSEERPNGLNARHAAGHIQVGAAFTRDAGCHRVKVRCQR